MFISIQELVVAAKGKPQTLDLELQPFIASHCGIQASEIRSYRILRRSIDARRKPDVKILYRLVVELAPTANPRPSSACKQEEELVPPAWTPEHLMNAQTLSSPIVVGAGPAGLFAALVLARAGARPVVLERGYDVERRKVEIDRFFTTRELNPDSNLLYGEGGAGTWSDGKLYTRIRDPRAAFVLDTFVQHGASGNIRYFSHPHIGSDRLPGIISGIRREILSLGGTFHWGCTVARLHLRNGVCQGVVLADGTVLEAPSVLIAAGHSARALAMALVEQGAACAMKGFQIGIRIEHPQCFINQMQFGVLNPSPALGAAEYNLSSRPSDFVQGVTSFCMCPGGEIIPATSDPGQLCTNGMSNAARNGFFANSALVSAQDPAAFATPCEAFHFLEQLEQRFFCAGGGDYTAPAQTAQGFLNGTIPPLPEKSSYAFGLRNARLDELIPAATAAALRRALQHFERIAPGFLAQGLFTGIETRVSSPVRFLRHDTTLANLSIPSLFLAGEGAGMAGGITSAAIDGVKLAESMLSYPG